MNELEDFRWFKYVGKPLEVKGKTETYTLTKDILFGLAFQSKDVYKATMVLSNFGISKSFTPSAKLLISLMAQSKPAKYVEPDASDTAKYLKLSKELDAATQLYLHQYTVSPRLTDLGSHVKRLQKSTISRSSFRHLDEFALDVDLDGGPDEAAYIKGIKETKDALALMKGLPKPKKGKATGDEATLVPAIQYAALVCYKRTNSSSEESLEQVFRFAKFMNIVSGSKSKARRLLDNIEPDIKNLINQDLQTWIGS